MQLDHPSGFHQAQLRPDRGMHDQIGTRRKQTNGKKKHFCDRHHIASAAEALVSYPSIVHVTFDGSFVERRGRLATMLQNAAAGIALEV
jgi:hypothetical protein